MQPITNSTNKCNTCDENIHSLHRENILEKVSYLSKIFKKLDENLLFNVSEFLINSSHDIIYECKSRNKPTHIEVGDYDDDDDDDDGRDGYYWNESKKVCTNCFKKGLAKSLFETEHCLPYLRHHHVYFTNKNISCQKEHLEKIDVYFLPVNYNIYYYRNKFPIKMKNYFSITMS